MDTGLGQNTFWGVRPPPVRFLAVWASPPPPLHNQVLTPLVLGTGLSFSLRAGQDLFPPSPSVFCLSLLTPLLQFLIDLCLVPLLCPPSGPIQLEGVIPTEFPPPFRPYSLKGLGRGFSLFISKPEKLFLR